MQQAYSLKAVCKIYPIICKQLLKFQKTYFMFCFDFYARRPDFLEAKRVSSIGKREKLWKPLLLKQISKLLKKRSLLLLRYCIIFAVIASYLYFFSSIFIFIFFKAFFSIRRMNAIE